MTDSEKTTPESEGREEKLLTAPIDERGEIDLSPAPHENTAGAGEGDLWLEKIRKELVDPNVRRVHLRYDANQMQAVLTKLDEAQKEAEWSFHGCVQAKAELFDERSKSHDLQSQLQAAKGRQKQYLETFRSIGLALGLPDPLDEALSSEDGKAAWVGSLAEKVAALRADLQAAKRRGEKLASRSMTLANALEAEEQECNELQAQNATLSKKVEELEFALWKIKEAHPELGVYAGDIARAALSPPPQPKAEE